MPSQAFLKDDFLKIFLPLGAVAKAQLWSTLVTFAFQPLKLGTMLPPRPSALSVTLWESDNCLQSQPDHAAGFPLSVSGC